MELIIFLAIGTVLMLTVMLNIREHYYINRWKTTISAIMLTIAGTLGTQIMFWIETGATGGTSFFGAIFFVPLIMALVAKVLKISISALLDMCAPAECIMLALMKIRCIYSGCCGGRVICTIESNSITFPSQIVEMLVIIVIMIMLLKLIKGNQHKNEMYALYMIFYGVTRFVLNLFRDTEPFVWILPAGNFWSLISMAIGMIWLYALRTKNCLNNDKKSRRRNERRN